METTAAEFEHGRRGGLLRYAKPADIARLAVGADLDTTARGLVEWVRLRSGALPDDVAVVLCREVAP